MLYIRTGYDVTNYFRSEIIAKKTVENAASNDFRWNLSIKVCARTTKFYTLAGYDVTIYLYIVKQNAVIDKFHPDIRTDLLYSHTRYEIISYFRPAFIKVRKNVRKCPLRRLLVEF